MAKAAKKDQETNVVELRRSGPADDAVKALNLAKMRVAKDEFETANGAYRNVLKHVEAKGINLTAAKDAISIRKSGKVEEKVVYLSALFEYLMILGTPIDKKQLDMFRVEQPRAPSVDKAKESGRYAGIQGLGMDQNPYAPESEPGQAWIKAWHGGCEERDLILKLEPAPGSELISGDDGCGDEVFNEDKDGEAAE